MVKKSRDTSEEPNSLEGRIVELATGGELAEAARAAIEQQLSQGIPVTYKRGNQIIKQHPDGHEEVLATLESAGFARPKDVPAIGER